MGVLGYVFVLGFLLGVVQLGLLVSGNVVFQVQHKFTGNVSSLTDYKAHDSDRHRRILSAVDLPLGGNGRPTSTALYYTTLQIGTPPRSYRVQIDTGSDILWVNCAGCTSCPKKSDLGIPLTPYDPKLSSSSKSVTCDQDFCTSAFDYANNDCYYGRQCTYVVRYGDGSSTSGYFVKDYAQLDTVSGNLQTGNMKGSIKFGCGVRQTGGLGQSQQALDGIVGFGQSNSSIISQLALAKKVKKIFSHCLAGSKGGIFAVGEVVHPKVDTTPILPDHTHFNIEMKAIDVGGDFVKLSPNIFNTKEKRVIIDSGTTLAYFREDIYNELMDKITAAQSVANVDPDDGQFKCYTGLGNIVSGFPIVTLHFANDLKLKVYPHQYLFRTGRHRWCTGFMNNGMQPREGLAVSLLGDLVLTDRLFIYNMEDQTIGWTDYDCSSSIKLKDEESGRVYEVGAHDVSWSGRTNGPYFMWVVCMLIATTMIMC